MDEKNAAAASPNVRNGRVRRPARRVAAEDVLAAHFNDPNYDLRPGTPPPPYQSVESLSLGPYHVTPVPDPLRSAEEGIGGDTQLPSSSDSQGDSSETDGKTDISEETDSSSVSDSQADSSSTASHRGFQTKYEEAGYVSLTLDECTHAHITPENLRMLKFGLQSPTSIVLGCQSIHSECDLCADQCSKYPHVPAL
jgi:hypothetical protein